MAFAHRALTAFLPLLWATSAVAADPAPDANPMAFYEWTGNEGRLFGEGARSYIFAEGEIVADTAITFLNFLQQNPPKSPRTTVVLNSLGGNLQAGMDLGTTIRQAKFDTEVGSRFPYQINYGPSVPANMADYVVRPATPPFQGGCYSACTFAFLGGVNRSVPYASIYAVHQFTQTAPSNVPTTVEANAQTTSGQLVEFIASMGVKPEFITEMAKAVPPAILALSTQEMAALNVITPRSRTTWQVAQLTDNTGFYLQGTTSDRWGTHEIAVTCAPKAPQAPNQSGGGLAQNGTPPSPSQGGSSGNGAKPLPPALQLTFFLDPGARTAVDGLPGAIQHYVLELDQLNLPENADNWVASAATVSAAGKRLTAAINISPDWRVDGHPILNFIDDSAHIGFAFEFKASANLPIALLQFEADLDAAQLKSFQATCH